MYTNAWNQWILWKPLEDGERQALEDWSLASQ
jgi:hypothetical protein